MCNSSCARRISEKSSLKFSGTKISRCHHGHGRPILFRNTWIVHFINFILFSPLLRFHRLDLFKPRFFISSVKSSDPSGPMKTRPCHLSLRRKRSFPVPEIRVSILTREEKNVFLTRQPPAVIPVLQTAIYRSKESIIPRALARWLKKKRTTPVSTINPWRVHFPRCSLCPHVPWLSRSRSFELALESWQTEKKSKLFDFFRSSFNGNWKKSKIFINLCIYLFLLQNKNKDKIRFP